MLVQSPTRAGHSTNQLLGETHMNLRFALFGFAAASALLAQDGARSINILTTINAPGNYILGRDIDVSGDQPGLTITASNVSIDLNGRRISGGGTGTGILIMGATAVSVRNGFLRDLDFGVNVMNSTNVSLTGLQISGSGRTFAAPPPPTGIQIMQSRNVTVRQNNISGVGLGIFVRGGNSFGNTIADNTVVGTTNAVFGICYNPTPSDARGPRGDMVTGNHIYGFQTGISVVATSGVSVFKGNGVFYTTGMGVEILGGGSMDMDNVKVRLP